MVAVAERFNAPDCESGLRGFESRQSPYRILSLLSICIIQLCMVKYT